MIGRRFVLGTAQFGLHYGVANQVGQVQLSEVERILAVSRVNHLDTLDTAIAYGASEEVLGAVGVCGFRTVTKLPPLPVDKNNVTDWVCGQVEASLARLGQKKLYGLLLHRPEDLLGAHSGLLIDTLAYLKQAGLVQKIGVSVYSPEELGEFYNKIKIDLVQVPINVVDRRIQNSGWLDRLKDDEVEVYARSAFLQGLLLMKRQMIPQKFSRWSNLWERWHETLDTYGISPLSACLAYPLSLDQVDRVIVGVDSAKQLSEILQAAEQLNHDFDTSFMSSTDLNLINPYNWIHL